MMFSNEETGSTVGGGHKVRFRLGGATYLSGAKHQKSIRYRYALQLMPIKVGCDWSYKKDGPFELGSLFVKGLLWSCRMPG